MMLGSCGRPCTETVDYRELQSDQFEFPPAFLSQAWIQNIISGGISENLKIPFLDLKRRFLMGWAGPPVFASVEIPLSMFFENR